MWSWLFGSRALAPVPLVLYTRRNCGLCHEMKAEIQAARVSFPWTLSEVDIDADSNLQAEYGQSIPVLWIGGRKAFKGRMSGVEFVRKFERMAREWYHAQEWSRALQDGAGAQPKAGPQRETKPKE